MEISTDLQIILDEYDSIENESYWYNEQFSVLKKKKDSLSKIELRFIDYEIKLIPWGYDLWEKSLENLDSILELFNGESVQYYKFRINSTKNFLHKGRYAFYLWKYFNKQGDKIHLEYFRIFFDSFSEYLENLIKTKNPNSLMIIRTFQLLGKASKTLNYKNELCMIVKKATNYLSGFLRNINTCDILEDISSFYAIDFKGCLGDDDYSSFISDFDRFLSNLESTDIRALIYPRFLYIYGKICKTQINHSRRKHAEFLERKATEIVITNLKDKQFIACWHFEEALSLYTKISDRKKIAEMKLITQTCNRELVKGLKPKLIYREEIMKEDLLNFFNIRDFTEISLESIITKVFDKINSMKYKSHNEVLHQFIETKVISKDYLVISRRSNPINLFIGKLILRFKSLHHLLFSDQFDYEKTKTIVDNIQTKIEKDILKRGIKAVFEEDYICAIFVLIPQIENLLRNIIESHGDSVIALRDETGRTLKFHELGSLLQICRDKTILKKPFIDILEYFLLDKGMNIRNDVAHGNIAIDSNLPFNVCFSFFILLYLLIILKKQEGDIIAI